MADSGSADFGVFCLSSIACFQGGSLDDDSASFTSPFSSFLAPNICLTPNLLTLSFKVPFSALSVGLASPNPNLAASCPFELVVCPAGSSAFSFS